MAPGHHAVRAARGEHEAAVRVHADLHHAAVVGVVDDPLQGLLPPARLQRALPDGAVHRRGHEPGAVFRDRQLRHQLLVAVKRLQGLGRSTLLARVPLLLRHRERLHLAVCEADDDRVLGGGGDRGGDGRGVGAGELHGPHGAHRAIQRGHGRVVVQGRRLEHPHAGPGLGRLPRDQEPRGHLRLALEVHAVEGYVLHAAGEADRAAHLHARLAEGHAEEGDRVVEEARCDIHAPASVADGRELSDARLADAHGVQDLGVLPVRAVHDVNAPGVGPDHQHPGLVGRGDAGERRGEGDDTEPFRIPSPSELPDAELASLVDAGADLQAVAQEGHVRDGMRVEPGEEPQLHGLRLIRGHRLLVETLAVLRQGAPRRELAAGRQHLLRVEAPDLAVRGGHDRRLGIGHHLEVGHLPVQPVLRPLGLEHRLQVQGLLELEDALSRGTQVHGAGGGGGGEQLAGLEAPESHGVPDMRRDDAGRCHHDTGDGLLLLRAAGVDHAAGHAVQHVERPLARAEDEVTAPRPGVGGDGDVGVRGERGREQPGDVHLVGLLDGHDPHARAPDQREVVLVARVDGDLVETERQVQLAALEPLARLRREDVELPRRRPGERVEAGAAAAEGQIRQLELGDVAQREEQPGRLGLVHEDLRRRAALAKGQKALRRVPRHLADAVRGGVQVLPGVIGDVPEADAVAHRAADHRRAHEGDRGAQRRVAGMEGDLPILDRFARRHGEESSLCSPPRPRATKRVVERKGVVSRPGRARRTRGGRWLTSQTLS
mmetsp:Transcript_66802/g.196069  ORF Transcript_66802/g.196069 Transcript_66802/m.196069 type:complete len:773 (+) Transcript_66802:3008-5326(+)